MSDSVVAYDVLATGDQMTPLVSVIVPIYNMGRNGFLRDCLTSLVNQDLLELEIICVDDASTDDSAEIALGFAREHENISVLRLKENRRQGAACNCGIERAKGRYIGFVDADDLISTDFYSSLWDEAVATGADIVEAAVQIVDERGDSVGGSRFGFCAECLTMREGNGVEELDVAAKRERAILHHPSPRFCIQRADVVKRSENAFLEGMAYEDTPTFLRWLYEFETFARAEHGRYYYRQHGASTVHTTVCNPAKMEDRLRSSDMILDDAIRLGVYEPYRQSLNAYYLDVYLFNTLSMVATHYESLSRNFIRGIAKHAKERVPDYRDVIVQRSISKREVLIMRLMAEFPIMYCWSRRVYRKLVSRP